LHARNFAICLRHQMARNDLSRRQTELQRYSTMAEKVKTILITQQDPGAEKNPYVELAKKHKLKIDYRPFIHVEGLEALDFRQQRVDVLEHTAVIFTSRNAVDHYFRLAKEMRITIPETMKYFCMSEAIAYYLQKYIQFRKRKIFFGHSTFQELMEPIRKHKTEKFLLPCSDILKPSIPETLEKEKIQYSKAVMYRTVCSDLSDLADVKYDMLVFFSPSDIESLFKNFPLFKQDKTRIAAFGQTTAKAVEDAKLKIDVMAPTPKAPSMSMAIEQYIQANK
jgi:uroporphyrinogen-III synthase